MKHIVVAGVLISIFLMSAGTSLAEAPSFDPDQPFRQSFSSQMLRSLLNQALDILDDHLEVAGDVSDSDSATDQTGRLQLKIYPKGKSQSKEHLGAEGWFRFSPDSGQHDFHFRFQQPHDSSDHTPSSDNVL